MKRTCAYGFEGGDNYGFTTGGDTPPTVQGTTKRTGNYALEVNIASGDDGYIHIPVNGNSVNFTDFYHVAYRFPAFPTVSRVITRLTSNVAGTANLELCIDDTGLLFLAVNNMGTVIATAGTPLSLDQWYEIEIGVDRSGQYVALKVNQVFEINWTNVATLSASAPVTLYIGALGSDASAVHYFVDDISLDAEGWIGRERVKRIDLATVDTDNANFTVVGTGDKVTALAEIPADGDTSYLHSGTTNGEAIIYTLEALPSDMIGVRSVWLRAYVRTDVSGSALVVPAMLYDSYALDLASSLNTASTTYNWQLPVGTGNTLSPILPRWKRGILEHCKFRLTKSATTAIRISALYFEIGYSDAAGSDIDIPRREIVADFSGDDGHQFLSTTNGASGGTWEVGLHPLADRNALRVNPSSGTQNFLGYGTSAPNLSSSRRQLFNKFELYVAQLPTSSFTEIWYINGAIDASASVRLYSDGSLAIYTSADGEIERTAAGVIQLDTLYVIQIHLRWTSGIGTTDGIFNLYVDGALVAAAEGIDTGSSATVSVRLGSRSAPASQIDYYYSNFVSDWLTMPDRDTKVIALEVTGIGPSTGDNWTVTGETDPWLAVDDPLSAVSDDDTTYIVSPLNTTEWIGFDLDALPGDAQVVIGVVAHVRHKRDAASNTTIVIDVKVSPGGTGAPTENTLASVGASYADASGPIAYARGRGEWTPALVNSAEFRARATSGTVQYRVTRMYLLVEYLSRDQVFARSNGGVSPMG